MACESIDSEATSKNEYEREVLEKGFLGPDDISYSKRKVAYQRSTPYEPIADKRHIANGGEKPYWPDAAPFAVCLTHDVDFVSRFSLRQNCRRLINSCKDWKTKRHNRAARVIIRRLIDCLYSLTRCARVDPIHCFEKWLKIEEVVGAKSTYFFLPEKYSKPHYSDGGYTYSDVVRFDHQTYMVGEMMREMDHRGWEIGLHASWNTCDSLGEMIYQKRQIETLLGHAIESVRQHHLHFDIRTTPGIQHKAGFKYDSSLGFNDNIGFRFGTCYPWKLFDSNKREKLDLLEIPLIIQDVSLLKCGKYLGLPRDTAFGYIKRLIDEVEIVAGVLTLLWHPNNIDMPHYFDLYQETLAYLKEKGAWFGTVGSLGEYWQGMFSVD